MPDNILTRRFDYGFGLGLHRKDVEAACALMQTEKVGGERWEVEGKWRDTLYPTTHMSVILVRVSCVWTLVLARA